MSNSTVKVTTKPLPESRLAVELEIPAEQCQNSFKEALSRLSRSANLPGFRKGKAPQAVLLQQIGTKRIQASALEKLLESVWSKALKDNDIEPLCEPELVGGFEALLNGFNPNSNLLVTLETDISPIPKLKNTKGLSAEAETIVFDEKKIDEILKQSQKQLATLIPIESRAAKAGDIAVVSFEGSFVDNDNPIEGGKSESMDIELEKGKMIPGFIEGIINMKIDEKKEVTCEFPKDYPQEDAKGRKASFKIHLKALKERELPPLDDAFAKQTSEKSNMKDLRIELEERLKKDAIKKTSQNRQEALLNELIKELEVELPKTLINQEIRNLIEQTARNFAEQGIDVKSTFTSELVNKLMDSSKPEAIDNLRRHFALNALAKQERIEISDQEVEKKFKEVQRDLAKEKNIDLKRLKDAVSEDLLHEKLLLWLEENNTIIEKTSDKPSKAKNSSSKSSEGKSSKSKIKADKSPNS
ncbi:MULTISPECIES: trigger factor [Prochlorococcus]|uniref:trigger factor n=1 Tax=Prochlorococcus TaxID=1218 RepID=UPI0005338FE8|nr:MULTISPECIES: trigger factor [Prochlorococcus]KGG13684.1 Cell division trigger factor [Prochlorococcus sp. MIT 0601]